MDNSDVNEVGVVGVVGVVENAELRPPAEYVDKCDHWIMSSLNSPQVARWQNGVWFIAGMGCSYTAGQMARNGWRYLEPAEYYSDDWEPSEGDITSLAIALRAGYVNTSFKEMNEAYGYIRTGFALCWERAARAAFEHCGYLPSIVRSRREFVRTAEKLAFWVKELRGELKAERDKAEAAEVRIQALQKLAVQNAELILELRGQIDRDAWYEKAIKAAARVDRELGLDEMKSVCVSSDATRLPPMAGGTILPAQPKPTRSVVTAPVVGGMGAGATGCRSVPVAPEFEEVGEVKAVRSDIGTTPVRHVKPLPGHAMR